MNNAGVYSFAPFEQFSEQEFHRQFNTNVLGTFLMIEAALSAFGVRRGMGRVSPHRTLPKTNYVINLLQHGIGTNDINTMKSGISFNRKK